MAGYRRLPSGRWQATVRLPDGRRRTRTDPLKGVVRAWAEDLESDIRRKRFTDPNAGKITVAAWHERWLRLKVLELATARKYASHWRMHVQPRWGEVPLSAIEPIDVEEWIADMRRAGVGATTLVQSARLLRQLLTDAVRHQRIAVDPTAGIKLPKVPKHVDRFLTLAEFDALAAQLDDRDVALVTLMAFCGLRWEEAAGLHAHRVDLDRGRIMVVEVLQRDGSIRAYPKSSAGQRLVPLGSRAAEALMPFLPSSGRVFEGLDYTNWRRRVFVPAVEAAALAPPAPTPHDLRHSYGSWLADGGTPVHDIAELMGHGTLRATERYVHSGEGRFARALESLERPALARASD